MLSKPFQTRIKKTCSLVIMPATADSQLSCPRATPETLDIYFILIYRFVLYHTEYTRSITINTTLQYLSSSAACFGTMNHHLALHFTDF